MFLTLKYLLLTSNILGFVSSQNSPKLFCPKNRSFDIDAIYSVIDDAKQYVYIAVTDYLPISSTSSKRSGTFRPVPCVLGSEMLSGCIRKSTLSSSAPRVHLQFSHHAFLPLVRPI